MSLIMPLSSAIEGPVIERFHALDDGSVAIERVQDVAPILEANERARNEGHNPRAEMRRAASIPAVVWEAWQKEFEKSRGLRYAAASAEQRREFLRSKLNDPENGFLRIWKGRIA